MGRNLQAFPVHFVTNYDEQMYEEIGEKEKQNSSRAVEWGRIEKIKVKA